MHWYFAAPFINRSSNPWLAPFVPNKDGSLRFTSVPATYHHDRSRKATGIRQWRDYFKHSGEVWRAASADREHAGIVTCFPQLPVAVGLRKQLALAHRPLVAWTFNLGTLPSGPRRHLARLALRAVDRFIVHSRREIGVCSEWLDLPPERFDFVPLQRAIRPVVFQEEQAQPFVLSMGSAQRDYSLLFGVLAKLGYRAVVVAGPHAIGKLTIPSNVEVRSGLTTEQCHELVQKARISVIPISNRQTASGQVTLLDAMMFARPVIITECAATTDYVTQGHDAVLIRQGDHDDMKDALQRLWDDESLRSRIAIEARRTATENFSDEAIGKMMGEILRDVAVKSPPNF